MSSQANYEKSKLHELVGRAMTDDDFANRLLDRERQPEALREMDIEPTAQVLEDLNHAIDHLRHLHESFRVPEKMAS